MKKFISIILSVYTLSVLSVNSFASDISASAQEISPTPIQPGMETLTMDEILDSYRIAAVLKANEPERASAYSTSVSYTVNCVCDNEWVSTLSSSGIGGLDAAEFVIDEISEKFEEWASISLSGYASTKSLTSTSAYYKDHLDEARYTYGVGSRDMMMAFSGTTPNTVGVTGGAYILEPYSIMFLTSYNYTWQVGRHETGHMFGGQQGTAANDYDCTNECVMHDQCTVNNRYDKICSSCKTKITNNRNYLDNYVY